MPGHGKPDWDTDDSDTVCTPDHRDTNGRANDQSTNRDTDNSRTVFCPDQFESNCRTDDLKPVGLAYHHIPHCIPHAMHWWCSVQL